MDSECIFLANVSDIPPGKSLAVTLPSGKEIVLFNVNGTIYALDNACPHMGGPLSEGEFQNSCITCPWHGWQFNVCDGQNTTGLGDDATSITILIEDGKIYLDISSID